MLAKLSQYGKALYVKVTPHNGATPEDYDEIWWVERDEDRYALMSPQLKDKKVLEIHKKDWAAAELRDACGLGHKFCYKDMQ